MYKILAAFIFFTRLPFWRLGEVPAKYFKNIVSHWAMTGWLTSGFMVLVFCIVSLFLPTHIALLFAILTRLLITGCLHEDGLADFLDGFGGGRSKEHILTIMKDSHIGSYGIIGLIVYFALLYGLLSELPFELLTGAILAGDPFSKCVAGMIINHLPYARKEEEAKNKTIYSRMTSTELCISCIGGLLPLMWLPSCYYLIAALFPVTTFTLLILFMKKKIQGYTGDCCGATFLLCELSFYLGILTVYFQIR